MFFIFFKKEVTIENQFNETVALLVPRDNKLRQDIISGKVTIAIRKGHCDYMSGQQLVLCCHLDEPWTVLADIVTAHYLYRYSILQDTIEAAGYRTREEMEIKLKEYYPDLNLDTPLTVIQWQNVRGKLVDDFRRKEELEHSDDYCH